MAPPTPFDTQFDVEGFIYNFIHLEALADGFRFIIATEIKVDFFWARSAQHGIIRSPSPNGKDVRLIQKLI